MKRRLIYIVTLFVLYLVVSTQAQVSLIMNGSFEQDGTISNIADQGPSYWCDVNIPTGKFSGWLLEDMPVHGEYSLTISTNTVQVSNGDIANISQRLFFENDIEKISFDLQLTSGWSSFFPWDHTKRTILLQIDANTIWDSNSLPIDGNGEYVGQVEVDSNDFEQYLDNDWHTLTIAMRVNESESPDIEYYAYLDFIRFDKYCGGFGYLDGDVSQDCYVDFIDFAVLAGAWLGPIPAAKYDLYEDGWVNENDLMFLAEDWLFNTDSNNYGQDGNFEMLLMEEDLDLSGQVDLGDILVLSDDWLSQDDCSKADIEKDGIVDFLDFARIAEKWQQKNWIYYSN